MKAAPLRYYQSEAERAVLDGYAAGNTRQLVVLATGLGKTHLFCDIARLELEQPDTRVLVLVHRDKLLTQAKEDLQRHMPGVPVGVEKAERKSYRERLVVASVQSLKPDRLNRLLYWGKFTLVIADECHHATAPSWRRVFDALPDAKRLGVTATPDRQDGKGLGEVFDHVAYDMQIDRGIDEGFLVPLHRHPVWLGQIDLSAVGTNAGDLKLGELEAAMVKAVEGICQETLRLYPDGKGPVFLPGKASANLAAARFNALKPGCAHVLTDDTDDDERDIIYRDVAAGRVQFLCNVNVATEGFDWPDANLVVMGRPTKSRSLYCQIVGRGTRTAGGAINGLLSREESARRRAAIAASVKPHCTILDFVGNAGKHKLVTLTDLFGKGYSDGEKKLAAELEARDAKKGEAANAKHYLEMARKRFEEIARSYSSKVTSFSEGPQAMGYGKNGEAQPNPFMPAAADQIEKLKRAGWPSPDKLSQAEAQKALRELERRRIAKLATLKQLGLIKRLTGINDMKMTFKAASAILNQWQDNNRRISRDEAVVAAKTAGYDVPC